MISAVICTRNRAEMVRDVLDGLAKQSIPSRELETVLVDSASSEGETQRLISMAKEFGARYWRLDQPGLSLARNKGLELAQGEIVAFLDDDVFLPACWAEAIADRFRSDPKIVALGGRIDLVWESERPSWLSTRVEDCYTALDCGDQARRMPYPEYPYGANMAFRANAIGGHRFDTGLGRIETSLLSNEEKALFYELGQRGAVVWYEPRAIVFHRVPPERAYLRWFLRRRCAQGRSDIIFGRVTGVGGGRLRLRALRSVAHWLRPLGQVRKLRAPHRPRQAMAETAGLVAYSVGCIREGFGSQRREIRE
jgi:glucosyl-dolichyl phosphate glucuronosyltransferase